MEWGGIVWGWGGLKLMGLEVGGRGGKLGVVDNILLL